MNEMRTGRRVPYRHLIGLLLSLVAAGGTGQCSVVAAPSEYQVKAAFLLNFTRFVEWPPEAFANPNAPFEICILGDDPFGPVLDQMVAGENVNGHKLIAKRIRSKPRLGCQVLFISNSERYIPEILHDLGPGILTVGDAQAFISEGGMIGFVLDHRRVRFDINQGIAAKASLKLSSKLLSVARSVSN